MSSDGHHDHATGVDEPRELSSPILWTLGLVVAVAALAFAFFHAKQLGRQAAAGEPVWAMPAKAAAVDHQALIADKSQAVIDRGQILFGKNCASCHGPNGDTNPGNNNPVPRNFHTETFKSKWGSGPYGFFMVLTEGYNGKMPAFANVAPADRYAIAHFVRETWMKPSADKTGYQDKDADPIAKQIPAAGAAAAGETEVDPRAVKPPKPTWPLMAAVARDERTDREALVRWLADSAVDCGPELAPSFNRIRAIFPTQTGRLQRLHAAAREQDRAAFNAALVGEDGAGSADPFFSLQGEDVLRRLYARFAETATRTN